MNLRLITENTLLQLFGRVWSAVLAFAITAVLARTLGAHYFGEYVKITSFVVLFVVFIDFGMNAIALRYFETHLQSAQINAFLGLRLILSLIVTVIAVLVATVLGVSTQGFSLLVVSGILLGVLSLPFQSLYLTLGILFQRQLQYVYPVFSSAMGTLTTSVLVFVSIYFFSKPEQQILWTVLALLLGTFVTASLSFLQAKKFIKRIVPRYDRIVWSRLVTESFPLGLVLIFNLIYFRLDLFILSTYRPSSEIGAYGLAYKFFDFAIAIPTFIMNSVYPLLLQGQGRLFVKQKALIVCLLGSLAFGMTGFFWFAAPLIPLIKSDYAASVHLLRLLALSIPIFFITSPIMWWYILKRAQTRLVFIYGVALVVNVAGNLVFIPVYGARASAVLTGITEVLVCLLGLWFFPKKDKTYGIS